MNGADRRNSWGAEKGEQKKPQIKTLTAKQKWGQKKEDNAERKD